MIGIFKDLPNEQYHAHTDSISRSGLWDFKRNQQLYWNNYLNPEREPKKQSPEMLFGSAFHTFVLEPHLFEQQYCVQDIKLPETYEKPLKRDLVAQFGDKIGAEMFEEAKLKEAQNKELRNRILADFSAKSAGKTILTLDQMRTLQLMKQSVEKHPEASQLIVGGAIEHSFFWDDPHTGVRCKTRPDILFDNMTVDLKTTDDASERGFIKSMAYYAYHLQAAFNREGVYHTGGNDIKTHTFICVEKKFPYLVGVYYLDQSTLDFAHTLFKNTLQDFKKCRDENVWRGYETKEVSLPAWAM